MRIPFNKIATFSKELKNIARAIENNAVSGNGYFTKQCEKFMESKFQVKKTFLTTSDTDALEMSALLLNIKPGDEIIAPSFTFPSTLNAFILRGAKPVFVDIRPDTLNINESLIESKITKKTKAIVVIHYGGVGSEMDKIITIAKESNIHIIEDAAQAIGAKYKQQYLGTFGIFGTYSFHETKNITCGEGGAILFNTKKYLNKAEAIREKGTNRDKYIRNEVNKYEWVSIGSSYAPSEILAAFLYAQLENIDVIYKKRKQLYNFYFNGLTHLMNEKKIALP